MLGCRGDRVRMADGCLEPDRTFEPHSGLETSAVALGASPTIIARYRPTLSRKPASPCTVPSKHKEECMGNRWAGRHADKGRGMSINVIEMCHLVRISEAVLNL